MGTFSHGGEKGIKQLQRGEPLTDLAAEAEVGVRTELASDAGLTGIVERDAVRLQSVADLFFAAVVKAAQDGDLANLERYSARFAWLTAAAVRAWLATNDLQKKDGRNNILEMLKGGDRD